jgi:hypothetical protein
MTSGKRVVRQGRVPARDEMFELPLYIGKHSAGPEAKQIRLQPVAAQFFLHEDEPSNRIFRRANAACGFETNSFTRQFAAIMATMLAL